MRKRTTCGPALLCLTPVLLAGGARAQDLSPEDENVNAIRRDANVGERLIAQWVQAKLTKLETVPDGERQAAFIPFREKFRRNYEHPANSEACCTQLAVQTAVIAVRRFAKSDLDPTVARGLAQALLDMNRMETFPGLVAGLKSPVQICRFLCAKGLVHLRRRIAADREKHAMAVGALKDAGLVETSPIVLGRIYGALNYPSQVAAVFEVYLAVFDQRLAYRRGPAVLVDGAEIEAYEFFRTAGVVTALNTEQKAQLVRRLAVFLRLDAQRYASPALEVARSRAMEEKKQKVVNVQVYNERSYIAQLLFGAEEILTAIVGPRGGNLRAELMADGYDRRAEVLQQAYRWVGHPETKAPGGLVEAPWDVPIGAP